MLALSTFRRSRKAENAAIKRAREVGKLFVAYVADLNLARYFIGSNQWPAFLEEGNEERTLRKHVEEGCEQLKKICTEVQGKGIKIGTYIETGRFAVVCLDLAAELKPCEIVTTRSHRPERVRGFFGSPVDELVAKAGCPVTIVE